MHKGMSKCLSVKQDWNTGSSFNQVESSQRGFYFEPEKGCSLQVIDFVQVSSLSSRAFSVF